MQQRHLVAGSDHETPDNGTTEEAALAGQERLDGVRAEALDLLPTFFADRALGAPPRVVHSLPSKARVLIDFGT
jgi:hypothetical protein